MPPPLYRNRFALEKFGRKFLIYPWQSKRFTQMMLSRQNWLTLCFTATCQPKMLAHMPHLLSQPKTGNITS